MISDSICYRPLNVPRIDHGRTSRQRAGARRQPLRREYVNVEEDLQAVPTVTNHKALSKNDFENQMEASADVRLSVGASSVKPLRLQDTREVRGNEAPAVTRLWRVRLMSLESLRGRASPSLVFTSS